MTDPQVTAPPASAATSADDQSVLTTDPLAPTTQPATSSSDLTDLQKLEIIDEAINTVMQAQPSVMAQVAPQAVADLTATDSATTSDQSVGAPVGRKEVLRPASQPLQPIEAGGGVQTVEYEPKPELPAEVESYLQHVEDHADDQPQEVVISGDTVNLVNSHHPAQPVIVLPITPETEQAARFKGVSFSIRWLITWSQKIIRMFAGRVIYRQTA